MVYEITFKLHLITFNYILLNNWKLSKKKV